MRSRCRPTGYASTSTAPPPCRPTESTCPRRTRAPTDPSAFGAWSDPQSPTTPAHSTRSRSRRPPARCSTRLLPRPSPRGIRSARCSPTWCSVAWPRRCPRGRFPRKGLRACGTRSSWAATALRSPIRTVTPRNSWSTRSTRAARVHDRARTDSRRHRSRRVSAAHRSRLPRPSRRSSSGGRSISRTPAAKASIAEAWVRSWRSRTPAGPRLPCPRCSSGCATPPAAGTGAGAEPAEESTCRGRAKCASRAAKSCRPAAGSFWRRRGVVAWGIRAGGTGTGLNGTSSMDS